MRMPYIIWQNIIKANIKTKRQKYIMIFRKNWGIIIRIKKEWNKIAKIRRQNEKNIINFNIDVSVYGRMCKWEQKEFGRGDYRYKQSKWDFACI